MHLSKLRTYPELNRRVVADKLCPCYRMWLIARMVNNQTSGGSGVVSKEALIAALASLKLNHDHWRTARKHPRFHLFFTEYKNRVELHSLKNLCLSLGVKPGRSVLIDADCATTTQGFKANLYAAWFTRGLKISRERLAELFNVSTETQRRWEDVADIDVEYNIVRMDKDSIDTLGDYIPRDTRGDERLGRAYIWEDAEHVYFQTVNTFKATKQYRGSVGNTRKIGKMVKAAEGVEDCEDATQQNNRIFYEAGNSPTNYQEVPGVCLRGTDQTKPSQCGEAKLWQLSEVRPVSKQVALR